MKAPAPNRICKQCSKQYWSDPRGDGRNIFCADECKGVYQYTHSRKQKLTVAAYIEQLRQLPQDSFVVTQCPWDGNGPWDYVTPTLNTAGGGGWLKWIGATLLRKTRITKRIKMNKFTIDRRMWARGRRTLLRVGPTGFQGLKPDMMCCVGFMCVEAGVPPTKIVGKAIINPITENTENQPDSIHFMLKGRDANAIYSINDDEEMDDPTREKLLTELFARNGWEVTFVN